MTTRASRPPLPLPARRRLGAAGTGLLLTAALASAASAPAAATMTWSSAGTTTTTATPWTPSRPRHAGVHRAVGADLPDAGGSRTSSRLLLRARWSLSSPRSPPACPTTTPPSAPRCWTRTRHRRDREPAGHGGPAATEAEKEICEIASRELRRHQASTSRASLRLRGPARRGARRTVSVAFTDAGTEEHESTIVRLAPGRDPDLDELLRFPRGGVLRRGAGRGDLGRPGETSCTAMTSTQHLLRPVQHPDRGWRGGRAVRHRRDDADLRSLADRRGRGTARDPGRGRRGHPCRPRTEDDVSCRRPTQELRRRRGSGRALRGVDLAVRAGELVAVTGPSGSGKSTLLNIVAGLERPDEGSVRILGRDLVDASETESARIRAATSASSSSSSTSSTDDRRRERGPGRRSPAAPADGRRPTGPTSCSTCSACSAGLGAPPALRWRASAPRHRPGAGQRAGPAARRRADRRPRLRERRRGDRGVRAAARCRRTLVVVTDSADAAARDPRRCDARRRASVSRRDPASGANRVACACAAPRRAPVPRSSPWR